MKKPSSTIPFSLVYCINSIIIAASRRRRRVIAHRGREVEYLPAKTAPEKLARQEPESVLIKKSKITSACHGQDK